MHALREWEELRGVPLRQLSAGSFHCVALSTRGEMFTWGHEAGRDSSNGNLLGTGELEDEDEVPGLAGIRPPSRVAGEGLGAVAEVRCAARHARPPRATTARDRRV